MIVLAETVEEGCSFRNIAASVCSKADGLAAEKEF
jgi:hypothetical protein